MKRPSKKSIPKVKQKENVQLELNNKADITPNTDIIPNNLEYPKKPSKIDKAIVTVIKSEPNITKAQLANRIVALGITKHVQSVYNRLKKKDYLNAELSKIEDFHAQQLQREDYPLARTRLRKALNDKDKTTGEYVLSHKEAFPMIKLVYDKVHGEKHFNQAPQVVNIESINNAQFNIGKDIEA